MLLKIIRNLKGLYRTRNWPLFVKMVKFDWRWRKGVRAKVVAAEKIKKGKLIGLCYRCGKAKQVPGYRCEKCVKEGLRHEGDLTNYIYNFMNNDLPYKFPGVDEYERGWNDCLDQIKEINQVK